MTTSALFVDLTNFYSHLLKSGIDDDPRKLRDYFLHWFDFDRLAQKLTDDFSSVWVFYSGRRLGPSDNRITDKYLDAYIERTNTLTGVTARDVNIEGKQRETASYTCENCKHKGVAQWESEKGIDASLTVHMFDTMDTWDVAYLLSGDADFVPVVTSLRRRGKIVIGAGFADRSSALVRECYDYIDLQSFLREDVFVYSIFKKDGVAQKWLTDEVQVHTDIAPVKLGFEWQFKLESVLIYFTAEGHIDLESRLTQIRDLGCIFPDGVKETEQKHCQLVFASAAWSGVERRLDTVNSYLHGLEAFDARNSGKGYSATHRYNPVTKRHELVYPETPVDS